MVKITKEAALLYHSMGKPGKIEVVPTKPYTTQTDLSLAYSPGVAAPNLASKSRRIRKMPTSTQPKETWWLSFQTVPLCSDWATSVP